MSDVTSIMDVKNAFAMELRGSEVVPVGSRVDEPLHQVERSAHEERCAERVHNTTSEPSSVTLASYVDLLTRIQNDAPDGRATRGSSISCRVPLGAHGRV